MNKNKIIMASIGGVALVLVAVLGYLSYSAWEEKNEKLDELEAAKGSVVRIRKAPIAPVKESLEAIEDNRRKFAIWRDDTLAVVSQGDIAPDAAMTPEAFKRTLVDEAREESHKPGGVEGRIVKDDFAFGFKDYISGGRMPDRESLPFLQRQWADVKLITDTLSDSGVVELVDLVIAERKAPEPVEAKPKRGPKQKNKPEATKPIADEQGYEVRFLARPLALVKVLNAFATCPRFVTVDSCTFARATDTIESMLGAKDKDQQSAAPRRGRRGRRGAAAEEAPEAEGEEARKKGLVTDPATDTPFTVTMKLTTFDFGSAAKAPAEGDDAAGKEAAE